MSDSIMDRFVCSMIFIVVFGIVCLIFPSIVGGSSMIFATVVAEVFAGYSVFDFITVAFDKNAIGSVSLSAFQKIIIMAAICFVFAHAVITPAIIGAIIEIIIATAAYVIL